MNNHRTGYLRLRKPDGEVVAADVFWWMIRQKRPEYRGWTIVGEGEGDGAPNGSPLFQPSAPSAPSVVKAPASAPGRFTVAHLCEFAPPSVGGIATLIGNWAAAAPDERHVIVTANPVGAGYWGRVEAIHAPAPELPQVLAQLDPAVCVVHLPIPPTMQTSRPSIWYVHGQLIFAGPKPAGEPLAIIGSSKPDAFGPGWEPDKIMFPPLGVDLEKFAPRPKALIAGIVGRLSPEKVPSEFVAALKLWLPAHPQWRVRVVGVGKDRRLEAPYKSEFARLPVEFVDDQPPAAMPDVYAGLDALLLPSTLEMGGLSACEALASGVPVVARDLPTIRYSLGEGAMYGANDAEILRWLEALEAPSVRAEMGRRARHEAESRHRLDTWANVVRGTYGRESRVPGSGVRGPGSGVRDPGSGVRGPGSETQIPNPEPRVSVVIPVWNTPAAWLRQCVESIEAQTFTDWELILVDDGSDNPETVAALDAWSGRQLLIRLKHGGISRALNAGIAAARTDLIARLDADDYSTPDRLQKQFAYLAAHPDVAVVGGQIATFGDAPAFTTRHPERVELPDDGGESTWWQVNHPAVMFRRSAWEAVGGYDERDGLSQDRSLWLRLLRAGYRIRNLPDVATHYRRHAGQVTQSPEFAAEHAENAAKRGRPAAAPETPAAPPRAARRGKKNDPNGSPQRTERNAEADASATFGRPNLAGGTPESR
jgi:glycosyltransferase involved in cell wall biosynthesis/GT2 family glycosyltransferase